MRILVCMCILSGCLAAQDPAKTPPSPPSPAAKQTKKAPAVTAIPKGAIETTPGFYRWTGKKRKRLGGPPPPPPRGAGGARGRGWARGIGGDPAERRRKTGRRGRGDDRGGRRRFHPLRASHSLRKTHVGSQEDRVERDRTEGLGSPAEEQHGQPYCGKGVSGE